MRLIDVDLFMENVRKELNCDERCCECVHDNLCEIYKMALKQPTAYDVDKVVEQLEDMKYVMMGNYGVRKEVVNFDDLVEIVKSGGID